MQSTIFDISNKTVLIIGASSGIGESFAHCLANANATVLVAARRIDRLKQLQSSLTDKGVSSKSYSVDITEETSVKTLLNTIESDHYKIDVLVNTAGINIRHPIEEYPFTDWRKVLSANLDGAWLITQAVTNHMLKHNTTGSIINISSMAATRTLSITPPAYTASKAAIDQMTRSMALIFAKKGIRFNTIAPGFFITDLNRDLFESEHGSLLKDALPMKRAGNLEELHGALAFTCIRCFFLYDRQCYSR